MTSNRRFRGLPPIPADTPKGMRPLLTAIRENMQITNSQGRGDALDGAVTWRDVKQGKLTGEFKNFQTASRGGGGSAGPVDEPTVPSGFAVTPEVGSLQVSWDRAPYQGHRHTNVYVRRFAPGLQPPADPVFDAGEILASASGTTVLIPAEIGGSALVWVAHENIDGVVSQPAGPELSSPLEGEVSDPTVPTGVEAESGDGSVIVTWDAAGYPGHLQSNVYFQRVPRSAAGEPLQAPDFDSAVLSWQGKANGAVISLPPGYGGYFFVTHVNVEELESAAHSTEGSLAYSEFVADVPSAPTGVTVTSAPGSLLVQWASVGYTGHSHTNIYIQTDLPGEDGLPGEPPDFSQADIVAAATGRSAAVPLSAESGAYIWVQHENIKGTTGPIHSPGGTYALSLIPAGTIIDHISQGIDEDFLGQSLLDKFAGYDLFGDSILAQAEAGLGGLIDNIIRQDAVRTELYTGEVGIKDRITGAEVGLVQTGEALLSETQARVSLSESVTVRFGEAEARSSDIEDYVADVDFALASTRQELSTQFGNNYSGWSQTVNSLSNAQGSLATINNQLKVIAGDNSVTLDDFASVIYNSDNGQYEAQWGIKTTVGGVQRGVGFVRKNIGGQDISAFHVNADTFFMHNTSDPGGVKPFMVQGGTTYINDAVIRNAYIEELVADTMLTKTITATDFIMTSGDLFAPRINTLPSGAHDTAYKFSINSAGELRAADAVISGTITGTSIYGSEFRTTQTPGDFSSARVVISGLGSTYLFWAGVGAGTDNNAAFYLKSNGEAGFNGKVNVRQLEGDIYASIPVTVASPISVPTSGTQDIFTVTVQANPWFDRVLQTTVLVEHNSGGGAISRAYAELYLNGVEKSSVGQSDDQESGYIATTTYCTIPKSSSSQTIQLRVRAGLEDNIRIPAQAVPVAVYRKGTTFANVSGPSGGGGGGGSTDPNVNLP